MLRIVAILSRRRALPLNPASVDDSRTAHSLRSYRPSSCILGLGSVRGLYFFRYKTHLSRLQNPFSPRGRPQSANQSPVSSNARGIVSYVTSRCAHLVGLLHLWERGSAALHTTVVPVLHSTRERISASFRFFLKDLVSGIFSCLTSKALKSLIRYVAHLSVWLPETVTCSHMSSLRAPLVVKGFFGCAWCDTEFFRQLSESSHQCALSFSLSRQTKTQLLTDACLICTIHFFFVYLRIDTRS